MLKIAFELINMRENKHVPVFCTDMSVLLFMDFSLSVDTALAKSALSPHGGGKAVKLLNTLQEEQDRREKKPLLRRDTEEVGTAAPCYHCLILFSSPH